MEQYELKKIYIENYRSFKQGEIDDIDKFNIILGPNNAGKSNIFRLLKSTLNLVERKSKLIEDNYGLCFEVSNVFKNEDFWNLEKPIKLILFFSYELEITFIINQEEMKVYLKEEEKQVKFQGFKTTYYNDYKEMFEELKLAFNFFDDLRGIEEELSGIDIGKTIMESISPIESEEDGRANVGYFNYVSYKLKQILNDDTLWIKKGFKLNELNPNDFSIKKHLLLSQMAVDKKLDLNLESVGSGIAQIVSLLTVIFKYKEINSRFKLILLLEEPEQNLHPEAIINLFDVIIKELSIQFIINTHSPWLIDKEGVIRIYGISRTKNEGTVIRISRKASDIRSMLDLIGAKPSQLLQSNLVIWVEGPSDKIYIKHWLEKSIPKITEGKNFSFVMYGGSLLSHYGYDNDDLINILSTSRYAILVSDLDRENADDDLKNRLNVWEKRIENTEDIKDNILLWKTDFREIENYIPHNVMFNAIKEVKMQKSVRVNVDGIGKNITVAIKNNETNFNEQKGSFTDYFSELFVYDLKEETKEMQEKLLKLGIESKGKLLDNDRRKIKIALNAAKIHIAKNIVKKMNNVPNEVKNWMEKVKVFIEKANSKNIK
ncbi:hypothetical protein CU072_05020 [Bacillus thuringiensis]|uniref:ATP-dependent nuclease n=1 Tax=Bacillus thuringiensis TaxID=1428 RepID=UPI000D6C91DD|nr:AAA family ATPase [Bacillus thuringiensis]PWN16692.1 hypothetical protein CU072_05020 [Bacillus thuringiensis]